MLDAVSVAAPQLCAVMLVIGVGYMVWAVVGVAAFRGLFFTRCYSAETGSMNTALNLAGGSRYEELCTLGDSTP